SAPVIQLELIAHVHSATDTSLHAALLAARSTDVSCHDPGDAAVADQPWADRQRSGCRAWRGKHLTPLLGVVGSRAGSGRHRRPDRRAGGSAWLRQLFAALWDAVAWPPDRL